MPSTLSPRALRRTVYFAVCLAVLAVPTLVLAENSAAPAPQPGIAQTPSQAMARSSVTGTVQDPTAASVPGATVQLLRPDGTLVGTTTTDSTGHFQFPQPAAGTYTLTITLSGFASLTKSLHIGAAAPAPLALTMDLASVATNVSVSADSDAPTTDPATNQDAATVTADDMKNLPIFDADIVSTLSAFVSSDAAGEGGTALIVDGVETPALDISPSAIASISVNQDPYSAQYRHPGRGQVEIVTKRAAQQFHGSASFTFRDAALEGTNYFAQSKAPSQRRIYEGYVTGPTGLHGTEFLFSLTRREQDTFNTVDAVTLPTVQAAQNVAAPTRSTALTMKVRRQFNENHSGFLLYRLYDASNINQNVGGQTLASAGYNSYNYDMDVAYHDDYTIGATKLNQFNLRFERNLDRTASAFHAAQVQVQGVATFGSAQNDVFNTEYNPNISDLFSWTVASHLPQQIKFGVQIPNLGRRILEDNTNRQGTYTFASVAAYQAGTPSTFTIQQGQSRFETLYSQPEAFILDQVQVTPRLTLTPGLRYGFQNTLSNTKNGFEPRFTAAYAIDPNHGFVARAGSGIYFRQVGPNVEQNLARYQNAAERSLVISNPCYANPTTPTCPTLTTQPPSLFQFAPGLQSPVQAYFGLSLEHQVTKTATLTVGYNGSRGWHALRTIDINAPLPPYPNTVRPNPNYSQINQQDSGGYQKSDDLSVSFRGRIHDYFAGFMQYDYQHADSNTQWSTFQPEDQYDPNAEWSRTNYDQRQRLSLFGTLYPDKPVTLGVGFYDYTPLPYTITDGTDRFDPGLYNARPDGVPRNSLNEADYQDLQLRLGYTYKFAPLQHVKAAEAGAVPDFQTIAFSLSSFNTLNRVNFGSYDGVEGSQDFMQPTSANSPRRLQLSAAYNF
ncbi:hypothetical protein GOB94_08790 [Granulicella sp. 5B5]|uniref:TonB-dependent receptor n=1 Tax=Granulicella sp. 5B5 TaxID=1617967 RepID=UPI0015F3DEF8|nr:TonB-dependent receptor [Granulicella sp. 5B5]QMV18768.1 hypothetical protein GOB94_08790 [Granulicella sp. 5B5]